MPVDRKAISCAPCRPAGSWKGGAQELTTMPEVSKATAHYNGFGSVDGMEATGG